MDNPTRTAEKSEIDCMTGDTSMGQQVGSGSDGIRHTTGWGWILAYGVIVFLVGLLALFNPLATGMATGLLIGVMLVVYGIFAIIAGVSSLSRRARRSSAARPVGTERVSTCRSRLSPNHTKRNNKPTS